MSRKSKIWKISTKVRHFQSEMEDIIGENPDLDMDDAETSFAFGYQPTPKEEMHEKARMPRLQRPHRILPVVLMLLGARRIL